MELVLITVIALAVTYKLGLFEPVKDLAATATEESKKYKRDHTAKLVKDYATNEVSDEEVQKAKDFIRKIDSIKLD